MLITIGVAVLVGLCLVLFIASRIRTVPASKALIISGSGNSGETKVVRQGGRTFLIPVIQTASEISLGQKTVKLEVDGVDSNSVRVVVSAVSILKVGSNEEDIRRAAERFLDSDDPDLSISQNTQQILTGSLRSIVAQMTVSQLISQRDELSNKVLETAKPDLDAMGLVIDSFQIDDISDAGSGYIENMGIPETERVAKEARIARARNNQEANDEEVASRTLIAEKNRELAVRESQLKAETDKVQAEAAAAGPLAEAVKNKEIAVVEQEAAEAKAVLREKQLDIEIRRPADAELYRREKVAEGNKAESIRDSEASAERVRLSATADASAKTALADADAHAKRATSLAEADSVSAIGQAEADAVKARGLAEATSLQKKAEAYEKFNDAAILETIISHLPSIAKELAAPMSNIKDLTVISTDGASELSKTVASGYTQIDAMLKSTAGVSLTDLVKDRMTKKDKTIVTPEITSNEK